MPRKTKVWKKESEKGKNKPLKRRYCPHDDCLNATSDKDCNPELCYAHMKEKHIEFEETFMRRNYVIGVIRDVNGRFFACKKTS